MNGAGGQPGLHCSPPSQFLSYRTEQAEMARITLTSNRTIKRALVLVVGWTFILLGIAGLFLPVLQSNGEKVVKVDQFFTDAAAGNLPAFCLVEPDFDRRPELADLIFVAFGEDAQFFREVAELLFFEPDELGQLGPPEGLIAIDNGERVRDQ